MVLMSVDLPKPVCPKVQEDKRALFTKNSKKNQTYQQRWCWTGNHAWATCAQFVAWSCRNRHRMLHEFPQRLRRPFLKVNSNTLGTLRETETTEGKEDGMGKWEQGNVEKRTTRRREKTTTKIRAREKPKKGLAAFGRKLWLRRNLTLSSFSISTATGDDRDVTSPCILGMSWFLVGSTYIRKAIHATQDVGML